MNEFFIFSYKAFFNKISNNFLLIFRFLDNIAVLMHSSRSEDLGEFLSIVYNAKITDPGRYFTVAFNKGESVSFNLF